MNMIVNRTIRLVPALLAVVALLLVSVAGTAAAAKLITGKQIKNGTVTSVDVRNNNLTGADLKNGSVGPGDLSAAARNQVRSDDGDDQNIDTCPDSGLEDCDSLAITGLTPGTWVVTGNVTIDNFDGPATSLIDRCGLFRDGQVLAEARTPLAANGAPGEAESISITQVVVATDSSTPVSLRCTEQAGENLRVQSPAITAVRVS